MKPMIGVTMDMAEGQKQVVQEAYIDAILHAGGIPLLIPAGVEKDAKQIEEVLDGLVLSGGDDVDPYFFEEEPCIALGKVTPERDAMEIALTRQFLNADKPILGICRGMQLLNIVCGGTIYQDLDTQYENPLLQHKQKAAKSHGSHAVTLAPASVLHRIAGRDVIRVNSFHHQAVRDIASPFFVTGQTSDGVIEAMESTKHRFVVGVQWHPEELSEAGDPISQKLFDLFVKKCSKL
ncbi:gamma-glutamyl-gamma-aminobutyrate hydrolase family protein [Sporosarcina sp. Te-1]|uniref:gamma-glutamyl-gamma-aminobutyrate hydrolase family protein n=1 Tax=Sporosarcina sp. Te-1 TaxID=2818390 RepID=UPI001A9CBA45|nr:gamma-glutamyl-gamma-aminobutyrate hydrolase family protein [Sporosarcina sp. Te-1]QTD41189.1 gamma-glutamyl-gamma-aminobutyrate hydrolase family protein [Sporosarcina sp. Te-1]